MAKVFGIHYLELKPGVNAEDFERFVADEIYPATVRSDLTLSILKGERGEREGKYVLMFEMPSVEARDRYWPACDVPSEAALSLAGQWYEKSQTLVTVVGFTDYVVVGK